MSNHLALRSGNPALQSSTFRNHLSSVTDGTMTLSGTVNKTAISLVLVILSAGYSWTNPAMHGLVVPAALIGFVLALVTSLSGYLIMQYKQRRAEKAKQELVETIHLAMEVADVELSKPINENPKTTLLIASLAGYFIGGRYL